MICVKKWKSPNEFVQEQRAVVDAAGTAMKKVCIVRLAYYPAETHTRRNAECLVRKGYQVDLICLRQKNQARYETLNGVNVRRIPFQRSRKSVFNYLVEYVFFCLFVFVKLSGLCARNNYDVIEVESMPDFLVFSALMPKIFGKKVILFLFEDMPELAALKYRLREDQPGIKLLAWIEKLSANFSDHVIVCHEMSRRKLLEKRKVKPPVTVVLNVPSDLIFKPCARARSFRAGDPFVITHHGTITENYGIQTIITAVSLLKDLMNIQLQIYGVGNYRPVLEDLVRSLNVENEVLFKGYVSQEELIDGLCAADLGVVALLNENQSPNKLFEMVALGKPVVASDLLTIRQHFDSNCLHYFEKGNAKDLANKIFALYHNRTLREEMVTNAGRIYESYKWSRQMTTYLGVYDVLLKDRQK